VINFEQDVSKNECQKSGMKIGQLRAISYQGTNKLERLPVGKGLGFNF
jgi:hypothetical protein